MADNTKQSTTKSPLLPECPKCGRRDKVVKKSDMLNGAAIFCFILGFFLFFPFLAIPFLLIAASKAKKNGTWLCRNCQFNWQ